MKKREWKERMLRILLGCEGEEESDMVEVTESQDDENKEAVSISEGNDEPEEVDGEHDAEVSAEVSEESSESDTDESPLIEESSEQEDSADDDVMTGDDKPMNDSEESAADDENEESPFEKNLAESVLRLEGFRAGRGISEDEFRGAVKELIRISEKCRDGVIDVESIEFAIKGLTFDRHVAQSRHEGEIEGRNAGIRSFLEQSDESDGLPSPGGGGVVTTGRESSIFSLAGQAR